MFDFSIVGSNCCWFYNMVSTKFFIVRLIFILTSYRHVSMAGSGFATVLLWFFVSCSALTKLGKERKKKIDAEFKEGGQRDWRQVLANGGVGKSFLFVSSCVLCFVFCVLFFLFLLFEHVCSSTFVWCAFARTHEVESCLMFVFSCFV